MTARHDAAIDLARVRADTPGCETIAHLNNAGASPSPRPVLDAMLEHLALEARIGGYEAREAIAEPVRAADAAIAALIGAEPRDIAFADSATSAWNAIFSALPFRSGDRILTHRVEYGSNYVAMLQVARRTGASIELLPSTASGEVDVEALCAALDERVALVAITHVPTSSGLVNPVASVGGALRGTGIPYLLDVCQSVGQIAIDVGAIGCSFLSTTGRKWLRGPRATGFLYVAPEWIERIEPRTVDLRAVEWTSVDTYTLRPDARRFEQWERSWAAYLGLGAAARYANAIGVARIEARVAALAESLRARLEALPGVTVRDEGRDRCGIVTFTVAGHEPDAIRAVAAERDVHIWSTPASAARLDLDPRGLPGVARASVHYFNTEGELDRLCAALPPARRRPV